MIYVNLKGGLGNQMFQYAAARSLSIKHHTPLSFNTEYFSHIPKGDTPRVYQLNIFNIQQDIPMTDKLHPAIKFILKIIKRIISDQTQFTIWNLFLKLRLPIHLNGFFQSQNYFNDIKDVLVREFTLKMPLGTETIRMKNILENAESVCINVRRGDYLQPHHQKMFGGCSMEYYKKALAYINTKVQNPLFCIFSDDPAWVKKEFDVPGAIFAGNDVLKDYEQLFLMSKCKHNIVANSSFAWWGAWLNQNQNKIVISPDQWVAVPDKNYRDTIPSSWIKIQK